MNKDTSPIDQKWILHYYDQFMKIAEQYPDDSVMKAVILRRLECVMDLVESWQKRNWPIEKR